MICAGTLAFLAVISAVGASAIRSRQREQTEGELSLARLLAEAQRGTVATAVLDDRRHRVNGTLRAGHRFTAAYPPGFAPELTARLLAARVDVRAASGGQGLSASVAPTLLLSVLAAGVFLVAMRNRRAREAGGGWGNPARFTSGRGERP